MKPVNQMVFKEMMKLGLLKETKIKEVELDHKGKVKYDRFGNKIMKTITTKNFRVANEHKNSKAKTYFIQEDVLEEYLTIVEDNK